jgi:tetratricopeptide (TPR) repeat protein
MMRSKNFIIAAAIALALSQAVIAADKKGPQTIGDLKAKKVEVKKDTQVSATSSKAMDNYKRFLELQKTDPELRAEAMRRLGDLNLESGELDRMATEVTAVDMQGAEAIKLYSTLLKAYPNYPRNDQVLYQLARAYETTGQPEQALATLDRVVKQYPQSPQMDEIQFRRGEILFSAKQYRPAQDAYNVVISRGASSAFYEQSLYKHGWSLFKQSLNEESLPSFAGVLDQKLATKTGGTRNPASLKRADRELVEDTLRVMSITFSYVEGSESLDNFLNKRGKPKPY